MAIFEAIIDPMSRLFDKIIPDPQARDRAKLELIRLQGDQQAAVIAVQMQAWSPRRSWSIRGPAARAHLFST